MKYMLLVLFFWMLASCQSIQETPKVEVEEYKLDIDKAPDMAVATAFTLHNGEYEDAVRLFDPRFSSLVRTAAKMLVEESDYSILKDGMTKQDFDQMSDDDLASLMVRPIKKMHEEVRTVSILSEFTDGDIKYFALKMYPTKAKDNYPVPYVILMPLKKSEDVWLLYDDKVFYRFINRIIESYAKKLKHEESSSGVLQQGASSSAYPILN